MQNSLPPGLQTLWESLEAYGKAELDKTGLLNPIGMTESVDRKRTLFAPFQAIEQVKGFPANTLVRMLQDMIVASRVEPHKEPPALAGILYGADLAPVEGGDSTPALICWLEASSGLAAQAVTQFEITPSQIVLGERRVIPRKPVLLAIEAALPLPDVGRGRIGTLDIRPKVNFRVDPPLTIAEAADLLLALALDPESQEADWNAVSATGINKERFLFERVCLRTAAVVISLIHLDSEGVRHAVEARFWDRMEKISHHVNGASQAYFEAFRNSEQSVFPAFSIRCSGQEQPVLTLFARKAFGLLLVSLREWLKKHDIRE
jgi:hypothetical protein